MFRRKEESLFDTSADANFAQTAPVESAATTATQAAAPVTTNTASNTSNSSTSGATGNASTSSTSGASGSTSGTTSSSGGGISRPLPDARPASTQSAGNFRPNASPMGGDITRNRMPETKATNTVAASSASVEKGNKSGRRVLTVGNDILLKGEIATCDRLVIEGKVDATLNEVHTVEISETGSFKGSAQIEDAEISGLFEGDLIVRNRLIIYATGKVRGKITYGEIEIERGGELTGEIKTVNAGSNQSSNRPSSATRPAMKDDKVAA